jgi:hypothetical protein
MNDQAQAPSDPGRRPSQHVEVTVGIAKGGDGPTTYVIVDPDGLARAVIDESDLSLADDLRRALGILVLCFTDDPTTFSGGIP